MRCVMSSARTSSPSSAVANSSRRSRSQRGASDGSIRPTCELTRRTRPRWKRPPRSSGTGFSPYHEQTTTVPSGATQSIASWRAAVRQAPHERLADDVFVLVRMQREDEVALAHAAHVPPYRDDAADAGVAVLERKAVAAGERR